MGTNRELTPEETQTVHVLNNALERIQEIEKEIDNPPDGSSDYKPQLTPQGMKLVKVPSENEVARVDRLENKIYDIKAGTLSTIEKNNAELPEADRQQLQKESVVALYSDKRSLELVSDQNADNPRSPALSQERSMALKAQGYRDEMKQPNAPSAGVRMSFPELFPQNGPEISLEQLDIREIEFKQNTAEITGQPLPKGLEGPQAQAQFGATADIQPLELPSGSIEETFLLNGPDITLPEPQLPGEDD